MMQIFHGSDRPIEHPEIRETNRYLDFGIGFYTTSNESQALRWASRVRMRNSSESEVLSVYNFDMEGAKKKLKLKTFNKADREWLDFVLTNRNGKIWPETYDLVIGPVADNSVYATLKLFETGLLEIEETVRRLKTEKLCDQILFHTGKALEFCSFIESRIQRGQHHAV
jgi:hypothetical protein